MLLLVALLLLSVTAAAQPATETVGEDTTPLAVEIGGHSYMLDMLVVRRPGTDPLPVALITHGSDSGDERSANLGWLREWAHDMANRGWLAVAVMRRGYGRSTGTAAADAGTCTSPDLGRYVDANTDDLEAALEVVLRRPDARPGPVLAIGDSAGGAAMLDLAARQPARIGAVIDISGGVGRRTAPFHPAPGCDAYTSDLVWNFARWGTTAQMPTLWLFAENDSWFRPGLVSRMHSAFTGAGGHAELVMLPPFGADGHALFYAPGGPNLLLPSIDRFLRSNALPTWDEAATAPMLALLTPDNRLVAEDYFRTLPSEKALAMAPDGHLFWRYAEGSLDLARKRVLANCKEAAGAECRLIAENFRPVTP